MSDYPLIRKYLSNLKIYKAHNVGAAVYCEDLEAELKKGAVMFGQAGDLMFDTLTVYRNGSHQGLLIGYQPIEKEKPVSKTELLEILRAESEKDYLIGSTEINELIKRLEKLGVTND